MADCVGCGYCCQQAPCTLGLQTYGNHPPPCKGLLLRDGRYWCAVILEASAERRRLLEAELAIGAGCCSALFNTQREEMLLKKGKEDGQIQIGR